MSAKAGLTAWERWELASFDTPGDNPARAVAADVTDNPEAVPPAQSTGPSPQELELAALREATYNEAFEQGRREGYDQGHKEGYAAGHSDGEVAGQTLTETLGREQAEHLANAVGALEKQIDALDTAVARDILDLALEIAHKLVGHTLAAKPEVVVEVIHEALAQLPVQHAAIHLHPEDASLARLYAGDVLGHAGHRIHENPKLKRGDVIVESGGSHVDATVANRWRRMLASLGQDVDWAAERPEPLPATTPERSSAPDVSLPGMAAPPEPVAEATAETFASALPGESGIADSDQPEPAGPVITPDTGPDNGLNTGPES